MLPAATRLGPGLALRDDRGGEREREGGRAGRKEETPGPAAPLLLPRRPALKGAARAAAEAHTLGGAAPPLPGSFGPPTSAPGS